MKKYIFALMVLFATGDGFAKIYTLASPDKRLTLTIDAGTKLSYGLAFEGRKLVDNSSIALVLDNGSVLGENCAVASAKTLSAKEIIPSPVYRSSEITYQYNQLELRFKGDYAVMFRLSNDGAAYRFVTSMREDYKVIDERAEFNFDQDYSTIFAYSPNKTFTNSFQNTYVDTTLRGVAVDNMAMLPFVVDYGKGVKITIAESDLESYPGMFLKGEGTKLKGVFAQFADKKRIHPTRCQELVESRKEFIAESKGMRNYPWRVLAFSEKDTQLPVHNLIYALASPNRIGSTDWIKPGKVAWDWWNDWGLTGVDFEAGVNTKTYLQYIDFAARNGIEYVILDEGWYDPKGGDMMTIVSDVELEKLVAHGKSKGVNLILWGVAYSFDQKLEQICEKYSKMGIAGFKIDFFNRDDQTEVERIYRFAETTARYNLLIDYHGIYKPTGMNRTYPNAINFEGVYGLEELKWSTRDMTKYDVTMPYIRMMCGPVDYTQGAMRNANKTNFRDVYYAPMSQGTRCHQIATYVVFDSPLVMLCDSPTQYDREQESVDFITAIPTVWDETRILSGTIGEYIVTARRSGDDWYIGALTDWTAREVEVDFSMLGEGTYKAVSMSDGVNAHQLGEDYKLHTTEVNKNSKLKFRLAPGGGFAIILKK